MSDTSPHEGGRRRGGRSSKRARAQATGGMDQLPFGQPERVFEPTRIVSDDHLEAIHTASLALLRDVGIDVLDAGARGLLARAGADVDGERVRFDPEMIEDHVASAPPEFTLHAVNPERNLRMGGNAVAFAAVASAPNASGLGRDRHPGDTEDYRGLVKLSQVLNCLHLHGGYPVEPVDIHPAVRHLHCTHDLLTLSDKAIHSYSLGAQRNRDCLEMVRIARGVSDDQLDREPSIYSIINASSPLRLDAPMVQGIIEFSARNQAIVVTPFTLAGAMAPVTIAGALAQQNAEALAGIALTQVVRRGAPVMYGGFTSNVDMKSGSPAFGTPEYVQAALVGGQLARRYNLPYRSSGVCAANALDAQAAWETVFSLWGAIMGGANLVFHAAGWMEGGLCASYEKMVLDADLLQMLTTFLEPLVVDDATLALEAIAEVGPGGHFFGTAHTQERYRTAFYSPMLSDWRNYETWSEAGRPTADQTAEQLTYRVLEEYEQPALPDDRRSELDDFLARRVAEGGVRTDF